LLKKIKQTRHPSLVSGLRFQNRILDLNQIKDPRTQTIVFQALLRAAAAVAGICETRSSYVAVGLIVQAMVGWTVGFLVILANP